jgi:enoyl-CoA hydratase/carnithine racemase
MDEITLAFEPPIAHIRLNRPERRNAISSAMWRALPGLCARIEASEALVVILEGAGAHFSAGADILEFAEVYRDAAATRAFIDAIQNALNTFAALDRPTIAAIEGNCIGGGLALATACDLRFCADDAFLAITPARLGLIYGFSETRRLIELVGPARAKDLLFSGRAVPPDEALRIGLIERCIPADQLHGAVMLCAEDLARLSQTSIRGAKIAIAQIAAGLSRESDEFRQRIEQAALGEDFIEGRNAFAQKRAARFTSRGDIAPPKAP